MGMYEQHYLKHWGIKGMKWGVRRYQNEDGTLTEAGIKRYNRDADEKGYDRYGGTGGRYKVVGEGKKQRNERLNVDANRYVREDLERGKNLSDSTRQLTSNLKTATDASIRNAKADRPKMDLSNMSDKEMRDAINRAMLERQYNDMFAPQKSTRGREIASKTLETAGNVLAITGSALGIALSIKALTGR